MCDWCEDEEAVSIITKGENKGDVLCESCEDDFIDTLRDEYLNDYDSDAGEWRTAKKGSDRSAKRKDKDDTYL